MPVYHTPVLLQEVLKGLNIRSNGIYIDCTFGGGGHAGGILQQLGADGKLIVFDQDEEVRQHVPRDERVTYIPHNFRHLSRFLKLHNIGQADGIMADLGVSSHQFDQAERGFSIRFDGVLDMRMDERQLLKAYDIVNTYSEEKLHRLFEQYGEVTNAKTLAHTIVNIRSSVSLTSISNFKTVLNGIVKGNPNKYFAQVFQALRIEVNDELHALEELLVQIPPVLKLGARVAIITFHSLEDRIVKNFFKKGNFEEEVNNPFEMNTAPVKILNIITKKPIVPTEEEYNNNPRSRSAKLRIAEKSR